MYQQEGLTGRVLIVSNRLPVTARWVNGEVRLNRSVGGLASALRPIHESGDGVWFGTIGDVSLRRRAQGELTRELGQLRCVPVYLSRGDTRVFYEEISNGVVWPLFHDRIDRLPLTLDGWDVYERVNAQFADCLAEHWNPGDTIWVHDYHLLRLPALLRQRLPQARIGFFLHIPFPNPELFLALPFRRELVLGLLGADLVGFHASLSRPLHRGPPATVAAGNGRGRARAARHERYSARDLAIGSDDDYVRVPMTPYTAQAFCDAFGFVLPTRKMVNDIWTAAPVRMDPRPLTRERESPLTFVAHHQIIEAQLDSVAAPHGAFVAGIKKDVVVTNQLSGRANRVAIYGWHYRDGRPIQNVYVGHVDWYVDYSHGFRPVRRLVRVGGRYSPFETIVADSLLASLLSDEGPIASPRYDR